MNTLNIQVIPVPYPRKIVLPDVGKPNYRRVFTKHCLHQSKSYKFISSIDRKYSSTVFRENNLRDAIFIHKKDDSLEKVIPSTEEGNLLKTYI